MELPKFKTLKQIAAWINEHSLEIGLQAKLEQGFASTDRHIPGTRLRHAGKGRTGSRIKIYITNSTNPRPVMDHNNAETYRTTSEVVRWLQSWVNFEPVAGWFYNETVWRMF